MVEQQKENITINDTGVLSKDNKESYDWGEVQDEITDYWDISGGGSEMEESGKMKFETRDQPNRVNDNVASTADGTAMVRRQTYCENGQCAMKRNLVGLDENDNPKYNHNNSNNSEFSKFLVPSHGEDISKGSAGCKHIDPQNQNSSTDNTQCNSIEHQTVHNTMGIAGENGEKPRNDVTHTVSDGIEASGAKDNCVDGENKTPLSIRDEMMLDSECTEERFRIDRKKLEQMVQAASEGRGQSGEEFFQKIMDDTKTFITWPSKIKVGAKSKKDPHIRICGKPDNIREARTRVMAFLDTKSNRVTIKMDVSHTEHSHVIGKGGNNIKRVMQETGCHIHFPDSNRNTAGEKSNQVSITGHPEGVENARQKIRTLLPIVLQFEIPNTGLPIPDLNSPMIQHLVQAYGISIQFKQRAKVYSTSCTVRGSADNTDGLKTGIQTLMSQVAGTQLPATTQIEIAPQHHNYMLTKSGLNVNSIIQTTGARIIFPDPTALPKKSTVYISGNVDSVVIARHKLMGCLPLLLMFDTKEESSNATNDSVGIVKLMETLDISINIKSKPKQPSKTVIIKSVESNIYNMFEARAKILGLDSSGVTRPTQSLSPKMSRNATMTPTPVIVLSHSHVTTPTVQAAVIALPEQKPATPITNVVLNGPGYVLARNIPSNAATPRPLSSLSTIQTPSQSPFPTIPNATVNISQGIDQKKDELSRNPYITNHISSPNPILGPQNAASMLANKYHHAIKVTSAEDMQRHIDQKLGILSSQSLQTGAPARQGLSNFQAPSGPNSLYNVGMSHGNSYENNRGVISPPFEANGMSSMPVLDTVPDRDIQNQQLIRQNEGRMANPQGIITNEEYLRQQLGLTDHRSLTNSIESANQVISQMNSVSPSTRRLSYSQSVMSPDSITESRASISSDHNSPSSRNSRLAGFDQFDDSVVRQVSPSGNSGPGFKPLGSRDLSNMSPMSNQHRSPQIGFSQNSPASYDNKGIADDSRSDISTGPPPGFEGHTPVIKIKDYDVLCKQAKKAMESKPVSSEVRTPTDIWSGYGFSKSMPFEMKEELKKLASLKGGFRSHLPTTYENGEIERDQPSPVEEEGEYNAGSHTTNQLQVPLDKGGSNFQAWRRRRLANMNLSMGGNIGRNYMPTVVRPTPQANSAFTRVNPNESLNRSSNSLSNNPINDAMPAQRQMISSPFNSSGNESSLRVPLPEKPKSFETRVSINSTPTIQDSLGLNSNSGLNATKVEPDIGDVLNRLGLSKYIQVFQQQEVDYQTFLTLTESDLKELGITTFGPRKKMLNAIKDLNKERDVFSGNVLSEAKVHENISDQMLQLQRLQLQQHRDNPQTTASSRLDPHPLLSPSRQIFSPSNQHLPTRLDNPSINHFSGDDNNRHSDRIRSAATSRIWQNTRQSGSSSGHW